MRRIAYAVLVLACAGCSPAFLRISRPPVIIIGSDLLSYLKLEDEWTQVYTGVNCGCVIKSGLYGVLVVSPGDPLAVTRARAFVPSVVKDGSPAKTGDIFLEVRLADGSFVQAGDPMPKKNLMDRCHFTVRGIPDPERSAAIKLLRAVETER